MVRWFHAGAEEVEEFQRFRTESGQVEKEYLELRVALPDTGAALRVCPEDGELSARARYLSWGVKDLERRFPRLAAETPVALALWGTPHG
jgi:hypothetical protein